MCSVFWILKINYSLTKLIFMIVEEVLKGLDPKTEVLNWDCWLPLNSDSVLTEPTGTNMSAKVGNGSREQKSTIVITFSNCLDILQLS